MNNNKMVTISNNKNWEVGLYTTKQVASIGLTLPPAQTTRGSVWSDEVRDKYIEDIKNGKYANPLVCAEPLDSIEQSQTLSEANLALADDLGKRDAINARITEAESMTVNTPEELDAKNSMKADLEDALASVNADIERSQEAVKEASINLRLSDGQQRFISIKHGLATGALDGTERVLVAFDAVRTFEESFLSLNLGVPVGAGLVKAMGYTEVTSNAVINLASHPYFASVKWSSVQTAKTTKADFATALLAICAGWTDPESSQKVTGAWLSNHSEDVTQEVIDRAYAMLDEVQTAVQPYAKLCADKKDRSDSAKAARELLNIIKRKNFFMTLCGAIHGGYSAEQVLYVLYRPVLWIDVKVGNKKYHMETGGGTSGNSAEYKSRLVVTLNACKTASEATTDIPLDIEYDAIARQTADVDRTQADVDEQSTLLGERMRRASNKVVK